MIFELPRKNQNMENNNQEQSVKHSDFSIDHILNRAGNNFVKSSEETVVCGISDNVEKFEWLQCSRYCPPKVPRIHKKDVQKRQLGRHPRIPFTSHQLSILEQKFRESPYLSSEEVIQLSRKLQLADIRVKIWFQNRRARERREKNGIFSENKSIEERKSPAEEVISCFSALNSPDNSQVDADTDCSRVKVEEGQHQRTFSPNFISDVSNARNSALTITLSDNVRSRTSNPYLLCNHGFNPNVPFFIPFVNFRHNSTDSES